MFCTQCGTQIDPGDNFCRGCGVRIGGAGGPSAMRSPLQAAAEPTAARPTEVGNRRRQMPLSPPRAWVDNKKTLILAGAVVVVVLLAVGGYLVTELLRTPAPQKTIVAKVPLAETEEPPPRSVTGEKKPSGTGSEPIPSKTPSPASKPAAHESRVKAARQDALPSSRAKQPATPASTSRGGASPGIYQTLRSTTVFESPSSSSRSVANIPGGVRVSVVNTSGDWLEVHSRRGNPPGFIRREDAQFLESVP
jgi:hypothetical protein